MPRFSTSNAELERAGLCAVCLELAPLPRPVQVLELAGYGDRVERVTLARYEHGQHVVSRLPPFTEQEINQALEVLDA